MNNDLEVAHPQSGSSSTWRKTFRNKGENQQQNQTTYGVDAEIWTRATLVGGERSHHCAIPCSPIWRE